MRVLTKLMIVLSCFCIRTMVHQERKDYDSSPKMKGKRAKASVSSFELNEPKEARAPIKFVQKRDFLLPRRKESEADGRKAAKWTKRRGRRAGTNKNPGLHRKGRLSPAPTCMPNAGPSFFFFLSTHGIDSLPLSHNNNPKKTKPLTKGMRNAWMDGNGTRRTLAVAGAVGGDGEWAGMNDDEGEEETSL